MAFQIGKIIAKALSFESNSVLDLRNCRVTEYAPVAKTADYTITSNDAGKTFTNRGASNNVIFTLPISPTAGLRFKFIAVAAQNMVITAANADTLLAYNDANADSVTIKTIGLSAEVLGDGTQWIVLNPAVAENNATSTVAS